MSPRHKKPRACGCKFMGKAYKPTGVPMTEIERILLYRDKLEALKLCDMDGLTQEEAGERMGVSRGRYRGFFPAHGRRWQQPLPIARLLYLKKQYAKKEEEDESMFSRTNQ